ncbi:MAG: hypothetical protein GX638_15685, partial [Crenarchaeota archaeon]|nr:hypothetical protein [Thermoproteota archaeon]
VMAEIRNYQTAINAYYTATGNLPGTTSSSMKFDDTGIAWADLATEGITDVEPSTTTTSTSLTSSNGISSKIKGSYYVLGYNNDMAANVLFLVAGTNTAASLTSAVAGTSSSAKVTNASISSKDAKFLDDKMDNGIQDSGRVQGFETGATSDCNFSSTSDEINCALAVKVGL